MVFLPMSIGLKNIFGIQRMINLKMDSMFLTFTFIGAVIGIVLSFILVPIYSENDNSVSLLISLL